MYYLNRTFLFLSAQFILKILPHLLNYKRWNKLPIGEVCTSSPHAQFGCKQRQAGANFPDDLLFDRPWWRCNVVRLVLTHSFPEPVRAIPVISTPDNAIGHDCDWITVGFSKFCPRIVVIRYSGIPASKNSNIGLIVILQRFGETVYYNMTDVRLTFKRDFNFILRK